MLIINLSNQVKNIQHQFKASDKILDLKGKILQENSLNISFFGDPDHIYPHGLDLYKSFIQELLNPSQKNKDYLDLEIDGLPLFWITETAIKHPITFWAKDYFLLMAIADFAAKKINTSFEKLLLILPAEVLLFQADLIPILQEKGIELEIVIQKLDPLLNISLTQVLKSCLNNFLKMSRFSPKKLEASKELGKYLFIINNLANKHTRNKIYQPLKNLFEEEGKELEMVPILEWTDPSGENGMTHEFLRAKPGLGQLMAMVGKILSAFQKIKKINIEDVQLGERTYSAEFIRHDLLLSLYHNIYLFFSFIWLRNYFSMLPKDGVVLLEDEFYRTGKTIITIARSFGLKSIGVQHAHFNQVHTVYKFSSEERNASFSNPLPDIFAVWGMHHKQLFEQSGQGPLPKVLPLGNPSYVMAEKKPIPKGQAAHELLWCLSSKECFLLEWDILKNSQLLKKFSLKIRLHPVPHVTKEDVQELLGDYPYEFSGHKVIEQAIEHADLVMGSAHSTTFIDALVNKRASLRLISNRWVQSFSSESQDLYDIKKTEDLDEVLEKFSKPGLRGDKAKESDFLILHKSPWKNFIKSL